MTEPTEPTEPTGPLPRSARAAAHDGLASVVTVDRRDDVAGVCGRVDAAPTFAVVVHAPSGNRQLATQLGMRRLVRHAEDSGRVIAIATKSRALASRARQAGVPVSRHPGRVRWDAGGKRVLGVGPATLALPSVGRYLQFLLLTAVVLAVAAAALTVAPSADVTVSPPVEELSQNVVLTASAGGGSGRAGEGVLPAREVTTIRTVTLAGPVTGRALVPALRAATLVTMTNSGDEDITVPEGAVLIASPGGVAFAIDQETDVPAGQSVVQQASALEPGPEGNVAAGTLVRWDDERFEQVQVTNVAAAAGGAMEERPAVAAADVAALQDLAVTLAGSEELMKAIIEDVPGDGVILRTAAIEVVPGAPAPAVGEAGTVVLLTVRLLITALAIPESDLEELALSLFGEDAPGELVAGSVRAVETGRAQRDGEGEYTSEFELIAGFSSLTEAQVRSAVKGRSPEDARSTLRERYDVEDADVDLVPGFMPWLPRFDFRIDVSFQAPEPEPAEPSPTPDDEPTATESPTPSQTPRP